MRISAQLNTAIEAAPKLAELKKVSKQFDSLFVKQLLEQMEKGSKAFGSGPGTEIYRDLFNQAVADSVAKNEGIGVGNMLYKSLVPRIMAQAAANKINHRENP